MDVTMLIRAVLEWLFLLLLFQVGLAIAGSSMEQQDMAPSVLVTLPGNVLHDIASLLDGHSLLALLRTCRDLHGSHALRVCLLPAVLRQMAAFQTALQTRLQALTAAKAMQEQAGAVYAARPLRVTADMWESQMLRHRTWGQMLRPELRRAPQVELALVRLEEAKVVLLSAQAAGQQPGQQQAQGLAVGPIVVQARQRAVHALLAQDAGPKGRVAQPAVGPAAGQPVVPNARQMLQAAVQGVLAGQPHAGESLQVLVEGRAQELKLMARQSLQGAVHFGQRAVRAGDGEMHDVLQAAVQAAQVMLEQVFAEP